MTLSRERWTEVTPSQFDHEAEGLQIVRELLPDSPPYRAWSNFEFRDGRGRWHEVDLLVLGRGRLHLVELKYYSGTLRGDDHTWLRDGHRAETSPLKLARRKAQYLAGRLTDALVEWARERNVRIEDPRVIVPFVQESVFLHHPRFTVRMPPSSTIGLYGPDDAVDRTGLPGLSERLLELPREGRAIGNNQEAILVDLMRRLGLVERRERTAGSWVIEESLAAEGEGWQDWRAHHQVDQTQHARIRFSIAPPGADTTASAELDRLAAHEFSTMSRLVHDGLLRPVDIVRSDLGTGLVYPADDRLQRLDLWLAEQPDGVPLETQLDLIRQIAEAVHYAHGNAVAHRALHPGAIWVRTHDDGSSKVMVGDWQSAGRAVGGATTTAPGVTSLHRAASESTDAHDGFRAPEGTWQARAADRFRLDVFGVGALAYYLLTGHVPAADAAGLQGRLRQQRGLDISPDLPAAPEALRRLVLNATNPSPSDRTPNLAAFLRQLSEAEQPQTTSLEPDLDPLEARPDDLLGGDRFQLVRRLGRGSTAVGLLVRDNTTQGTDAERVLKVALDDSAAARLRDEAEVLKRLDDPRLVHLLDGPLTLGGRTALLLESAGTETLAEVLRQRARLSLDLLERYGTDLLQAVAALDRAGLDHRDIKPANLGVRTNRRAAKHLVLFDFSLTRAAASATEAGTPPYLDPFLSSEDRGRYDSHAERYAAAVVLFEMATGSTPVYGDGSAHPASVSDEATVRPSAFDSSIAEAMVAFFTKALARDTAERHHTVADMLQEWRAAFATPTATTVPADADDRAAAARPDTPLAEAGLSARALSAVEPLGVVSVADLAAVDPMRLNRLSGSADVTRREVKRRAKQWRDRFPEAVRGPARSTPATSLPAPQSAAELLLARTGRGRSPSRQAMAHLLLGDATNLDAFATQAQLAAHLSDPVTPARATQILMALQEAWATDPRTCELLDALLRTVGERLDALGGVATVDELTEALLESMTPRDVEPAPLGSTEWRLVRGLLRVIIDRQRGLVRAEAEETSWYTRRRDGEMSLVATDAALIDVAESLGRAADRLVATGTGEQHDLLVPADVVAERLARVGTPTDAEESGSSLESGRRVRLAARVSQRAAASGAGELHHRDLPLAVAVGHTLRGVATHQVLSQHAVKDRVRARFPALAPLPDRPSLDAVVGAAGLGLVYDQRVEGYRGQDVSATTTGLDTRQPTHVVQSAPSISEVGVAGQRLRDSRSRRSFLVLGVPGHRLDRAVRVLTDEFGAVQLDLAEVLLHGVRRESERAGLPWATVEAADAAEPGSRPAQGLAALVERSLPSITSAIEEAMDQAPVGDRPVLLTEVATLARYGHLGVLAEWADLTRRRRQALWLVAPQLLNVRGPVLDGHPITLSSPGQFLALDTEWIDSRDSAPQPTTVDAGATA